MKKILLGITGGIAAYKAPDLIRELVKNQFSVTVIMTRTAHKFTTPEVLRAISQNEVFRDLFNTSDPVPHINLARQADAVLIAPATANFIAKAAYGLADDLLSTTLLAAKCPVIICPSMNSDMYQHRAVQENLKRLQSIGYTVVEPQTGLLACGDEGPGRLPDVSTICECIKAILSPKDLNGKKILITAGPTQEPIDPVRFISNRSSGKMGYALAKIARRRGAEVTLISGPTSIPRPWGIDVLDVKTAEEMYRAVLSRFKQADIVIKSAAVSDYKMPDPFQHKIKKNTAGITLELEATRDILKELGLRKGRQTLVGFAAETNDSEDEPRKKLKDKHLDLIVANNVSKEGVGFGYDTNRVLIIRADGKTAESGLLAKDDIAEFILDNILDYLSLGKNN